MKMYTIAEVAKATGVNKQTVRRRARELGIYDQMAARDARGTIVMTAEQASALSDAIVKAAPEAMASIAGEADHEMVQEMHDAIVDALRDALGAKDLLIGDLQDRVERLRAEREAEVADLRERLARKEEECARLRDYARRLEHAHWWQKRAVVESFGLLPPAGDSQGGERR